MYIYIGKLGIISVFDKVEQVQVEYWGKKCAVMVRYFMY